MVRPKLAGPATPSTTAAPAALPDFTVPAFPTLDDPEAATTPDTAPPDLAIAAGAPSAIVKKPGSGSIFAGVIGAVALVVTASGIACWRWRNRPARYWPA